LIPLLLPIGRIAVFARGNPKEMIILPCWCLGTKERRIYTLVAERYLVLFMVVDMTWIFDNTQEKRNSISRKLRAGKASKCFVVKCLTCFWTNLDRCTAGSSFVIREPDTIHVGLGHARELTYDLGDFRSSAVR
jgi:hypothetical protein